MTAKGRLKRAFRNPEVFRRGLVRESASLMQRGHLAFDEARAKRRDSERRCPRIFSLEVHPSAIADLAVRMTDVGLDVLRWSISSASHGNRQVRRAPDPVSVVSAHTWKSLDENMIYAFQDRYARFLPTFDGFVACYPIAFAEIFRGLDRPLLAVSATRFEVPYTLDPEQWNRLNNYLLEMDTKGLLTLAADNAGVRYYIAYFAGLLPKLVPSVCDYVEISWSQSSDQRVICSRCPELERDFVDMPQSDWQSVQTAFGRKYKWKYLVA